MHPAPLRTGSGFLDAGLGTCISPATRAPARRSPWSRSTSMSRPGLTTDRRTAPGNCPFQYNDRRRPAGTASGGLSGRFLTVPFLTGVRCTVRGPHSASQAAHLVGGHGRPILAAHDVYRGTRSLRREDIGRLALWMRCPVVRAAPLAPRSGLNDLITLQNWWSGAGSNRRPSAFQKAGQVQVSSPQDA